MYLFFYQSIYAFFNLIYRIISIFVKSSIMDFNFFFFLFYFEIASNKDYDNAGVSSQYSHKNRTSFFWYFLIVNT